MYHKNRMYHHHFDLMLNVLHLIVFLNLVLLVVDRTVGFAVVGVGTVC
jgi:hypothetical protein